MQPVFAFSSLLGLVSMKRLETLAQLEDPG